MSGTSLERYPRQPIALHPGIVKCPNCGAVLKVALAWTVYTCGHCRYAIHDQQEAA